MICRTLDDIDAAAAADAKNDPPMTREQARYLAALLAPYVAPPASAAWAVAK